MYKNDQNNTNIKELLDLYTELEKTNLPDNESDELYSENDNDDILITNGVKLKKNTEGEYCFEDSEEEKE